MNCFVVTTVSHTAIAGISKAASSVQAWSHLHKFIQIKSQDYSTNPENNTQDKNEKPSGSIVD